MNLIAEAGIAKPRRAGFQLDRSGFYCANVLAATRHGGHVPETFPGTRDA
jgi:hypothetical protein